MNYKQQLKILIANKWIRKLSELIQNYTTNEKINFLQQQTGKFWKEKIPKTTVLKKGILKKYGKYRKKAAKKFVILLEIQLKDQQINKSFRIFDTKSSTKPCQIIDNLNGFNCRVYDDKNFILKKKFTFGCDTTKEQNQWVNAITNSYKRYNEIKCKDEKDEKVQTESLEPLKDFLIQFNIGNYNDIKNLPYSFIPSPEKRKEICLSKDGTADNRIKAPKDCDEIIYGNIGRLRMKF